MNRIILAALIVANLIVVAGIARANEVQDCLVVKGELVCAAPRPLTGAPPVVKHVSSAPTASK